MRHALRHFLYFCALAFNLVATTAIANSVGDLQTIQQKDQQFLLETTVGSKLIVTLIDEQTFRIEAHGPNVKAEAVNSKAPIIIEKVTAKFTGTLTEHPDFYAIDTQTYQLQINKSPPPVSAD